VIIQGLLGQKEMAHSARGETTHCGPTICSWALWGWGRLNPKGSRPQGRAHNWRGAKNLSFFVRVLRSGLHTGWDPSSTRKQLSVPTFGGNLKPRTVFLASLISRRIYPRAQTPPAGSRNTLKAAPIFPF